MPRKLHEALSRHLHSYCCHLCRPYQANVLRIVVVLATPDRGIEEHVLEGEHSEVKGKCAPGIQGLAKVILTTLADVERPCKGRTLARRAGRRYTSHWRLTLSRLVQQGTIEKVEGGYWLRGRLLSPAGTALAGGTCLPQNPAPPGASGTQCPGLLATQCR